MATGGIFQLITNDGKQDRMLMATALLNKRLLDIEQIRSRNPKIRDPTPPLGAIESGPSWLPCAVLDSPVR